MDQFRPPGAAMPFPPPRRHSTAPISFQPPPPQTAPKPVTGGSVETLYNHPSVKIVAFTAGKSAFDRLGSGHDDKPGTLPSSSQFERTIAIGMCCRNILFTILKKMLTYAVQVVSRSTEPLVPLPSSGQDPPSSQSYPRANVGAWTNNQANLSYKFAGQIIGE